MLRVIVEKDLQMLISEVREDIRKMIFQMTNGKRRGRNLKGLYDLIKLRERYENALHEMDVDKRFLKY